MIRVRLLVWLALVGLHVYCFPPVPRMLCGGEVATGDAFWIVHLSESHLVIHVLLLLSAVVLMPLGFELSRPTRTRAMVWTETLAGCMLGLSMVMEPIDPRLMFMGVIELRKIVPVGFLLSLLWLYVRLQMLRAICRERTWPGVLRHDQVCLDMSQAFPAIGAAWLVAYRANWTPLSFDPLIVLLTAAHFHHAGFTLPLMAGLNAKASPGCWTRFSCVAILAGVPLVAAGITCTHFGVLRFVEPFGVTVLVLGALVVAVSQIRRGLEKQCGWLVRAGFLISGASLLSAMILAMGFGLRHVVPNWALTMPQMWMIHGTLNAFGFGLCGLLAWRGAQRESGTGL